MSDRCDMCGEEVELRLPLTVDGNDLLVCDECYDENGDTDEP